MWQSDLKSKPAAAIDLLRLPVLRSLLHWRHARTLLQIPLFVIAVAMILHGFFGPPLAPRNLATTLTWIHFRGALVMVLLFAGNFFCLSCPFMLVRNFARKFFHPVRNWPRGLRNKWVSISLLVLVLFFYEWFDLWSSPWWTASLIVMFFAGAVLVDSVFKHATFCKFVCPIGQFNFVAATVSPFEVAVRDHDVCTQCRTKDCIRGTRAAEAPLVVLQRGCELALYQPRKVGNLDCTFCLDCVQACPYDNVGILSRVPAEELVRDPMRSGLGILSKRRDMAALVVVFAFGALLNAFGMVSPVYVLEQRLATLFGVTTELPVLAFIFGLFLLAEPIVLLGGAAWITRTLSGNKRSLLSTAARFAYSLVPLGFGIWLGHYSFHFLTGVFTFIPVTQAAVAELGAAILGQPRWGLTGMAPNVVQLFEFGFIALGLLGSLLVSYSIAATEELVHPVRVFAPWAALSLLLAAAAFWLMAQPMEMRGVVLGSG